MSKVARLFEHSNAISTHELNEIISNPGKGTYLYAELLKDITWNSLEGIEISLVSGTKVHVNPKIGRLRFNGEQVDVDHDDYIILKAIVYS